MNLNTSGEKHVRREVAEAWLLAAKRIRQKAETQNFVLYKPAFSLTATFKIFKA